MHIVIAVVGILTAGYLLIMRARGAAEMTHELMDVADDVRAAARRLGFRRVGPVHPVDAIEDANTAAATVATAYMELHGLPTEDLRNRLSSALQTSLEVDASAAREMMVLGRWLMTECQGAAPAVTRASRRLSKLTEGDVGPLMDILKAISDDPLSDTQREALDDIKRAFRIR